MASKCRGRLEVTKIIRRQDDGFTILKGTFLSYQGILPAKQFSVMGPFPSCYLHDEFEVIGEWQTHPTFGYRFIVHQATRVFPHTEKGIVLFLKKMFEKVGTKTAKTIVDAFGVQTLWVLEYEPERLAVLSSISKKKADELHRRYMELKMYDQVALFGLGLGMSFQLSLDVFMKYGKDSIEEIQENPYRLMSFAHTSFALVDQIAQRLGFPAHHSTRLQAALLQTLLETAEKEGHLYLPYEEWGKRLLFFLKKHGEPRFSGVVWTTDELQQAIFSLEEKGLIVQENDRIYAQTWYRTEQTIVEQVERLLSASFVPLGTPLEQQKAISDFEEEHQVALAPQQRQGVLSVLRHQGSIITGGPGTGKTKTVQAILAVFRQLYQQVYGGPPKIACIAPTGIASRRMEQMTGIDAKTICRFMGN